MNKNIILKTLNQSIFRSFFKANFPIQRSIYKRLMGCIA